MDMDWKGADPRLIARAMEYGLHPQATTPTKNPGLYWGSGSFGAGLQRPAN